MAVEAFEVWKKARQEVHYAKTWQNMPNEKSHLGDKFLISPAHSKITLVRAGQHTHGSANYHNSPEALNKAILHVLSTRGDDIINQAIEHLKHLEAVALINCQNDVKEMQEAIDAVMKQGFNSDVLVQ